MLHTDHKHKDKTKQHARKPRKKKTPQTDIGVTHIDF